MGFINCKVKGMLDSSSFKYYISESSISQAWHLVLVVRIRRGEGVEKKKEGYKEDEEGMDGKKVI